MITKIGLEVVAASNDHVDNKRSWVVPAIIGGTALGAGALYGLNQAGMLGDSITMDTIRALGAGAADKLHGAGDYLANAGNAAVDKAHAMVPYITNAGAAARDYLANAGSAAGDYLANAGSAAMDRIHGAGAYLANAGGNAGAYLSELGSNADDKLQGAGEAARNAAEKVYNSAYEYIRGYPSYANAAVRYRALMSR